MKARFVILVLAVAISNALVAQVKVENLRCESLVNPQGIDVLQPRLSWQISSDQNNVQQTGYRLLVASTKEKLDKNEADLWDVQSTSPQSIQIVYKGKNLKSRTACFWKVKLKTNKGESAWSKPAQWSMGLLSPSDWKAKWIGYDKASAWDSVTQWSRLSARYLRKSFTSQAEVRKATVYISGLGLYELYINGKRVSDHVLAPAPTDYRKTVLYNTHDVTDAMRAGENVLATVLGNGRFFTMRQNYKTQKHNTFGFPKLLLQLEIEYANGTRQLITSDQTWKLNVDGPIRTNNEYDGEEYDATKELPGWNNIGFADASWSRPELVKAPAGKLTAQLNEPMKVMQEIKPVKLTALNNGKCIIDMGQNFSGWLRMSASGKKGEQVKLRFAESLQPNGELYVANLRDARVTDIYTFKGAGVETWEPSFIYHGFRYVEVTGFPGAPTIGNFMGRVVYDDLQNSSAFSSSDSTLNRIHRNAWWGIASNYKGMPVDCPQRNERQPWLGDRATGSGGEAFLFDNAKLYAKWLDDIEDSQTPEGAIPDVAPAFWNYYSDNMTWPGTYILVADLLHRQFGDERSITKHYPSMKKWMHYMKSKYMKNFIVTKDKYGDWCVPPESLELIRSRDSTRTTRGDLLATAYYYQLLKYMRKFAGISGQTVDVKQYDELAEKIREAFNKKFFNAGKNSYDNNTVTANLLPLYFGITPENARMAVFNNIRDKITIADKMHISTGVIGTQWLMRGLTEFGRPDIALALASNESYPSWGYMINNGATTIWELWNGNTANPQMNSQNHVMLLGDLLIWYYENLAGIKSDLGQVAFKKIIMKPEFNIDLKEVNASYRSSYGLIGSNWKKANGSLSWQVIIPANTTALMYVPASLESDVKIDGKQMAGIEGAKLIKLEHGKAVFELGSGKYSITTNASFTKN